MPMWLIPASALLSWAALTAFSETLADEVTDYGAYLSGECVTCHRVGNSDSRVPSLAGRSRESILTALLAFKSGERSATVMQNIAARLAEDEMLALSAYFSSLATSEKCFETPSAQEKPC